MLTYALIGLAVLIVLPFFMGGVIEEVKAQGGLGYPGTPWDEVESDLYSTVEDPDAVAIREQSAADYAERLKFEIEAKKAGLVFDWGSGTYIENRRALVG